MSRQDKALKFKRELNTLRKMTLVGIGAKIDLTENDVIMINEDDIQHGQSGDKWQSGMWYNVGTIVLFNNKNYETIQSHLSLWNPDTVPTLFKVIAQPGITLDWKQPTGMHDAYNVDDIVKYNNKTWKSTVNGNMYPPGAVPGQWVEVKKPENDDSQ